MPKRIALLDNIEYTIQQELLESVTKDIKKKLFKNKDIKTYYASNYEDNNINMTKFKNDVNNWLEFLEVSIEYTTNDMELETTILREYNKTYLEDDDISLRVHPVTYNNRYNIRFKYSTKYKNKLVKLINTLKASDINNSSYMQHMIEYFFTIPKELLLLLKNIYYLKTGNNIYYDYIEEISQVPIDYINSRTKDYQIPVIRERQGIYGSFNNDFLDISKIDQDEFGYYIELEYVIDITLPTSLLVKYPLLVCNKPIDNMFIPKIDRPKILPGANNVIDNTWLMNKLKYMNTYENTRPIINYPEIDDFIPTVPYKPDTVRLLTILCTINENDKRTLANINDILYLIANEDFKDYILNHPDKNRLVRLYEDIVYIELFENDNPKDNYLEIDETGNIKAMEDLDLCKTYRLSLDIVYNIDAIEIFIRDKYDSNFVKNLANIIKGLNLNPKYTGNYNILKQMIAYILLKRR